MKRYLLLIALMPMLFVVSAQSSTDFLKTDPYITNDTPQWAKEMYSANPNVLLVDQLYEEYFAANSFKKSIHTQNYKFWRKQIESLIEEDGSINAIDILENQKFIFNKKNGAFRSNNQWTPIGPFETLSTDGDLTKVSWQANVYTIDQSKSNPNIVFAGTEAGGIFKSNDKGLNWQMTSGNTLMRTIRSIKIDPQNPSKVYAGDGNAIYKTIDGGSTWFSVYNQNGLNVNDISIHAVDSDILLVASNLGLLRSEDGGQSWVTIVEDNVWDIEQNTNDPSQYYILKSNELEIKSEFWKSTDHGQNFSVRDIGWYDSDDPNRINGGGRMTVTNADDKRIYVILIGASKEGDNGFIGVYKSSDAGETWEITDPPIGGPYDDNHNNLATLSNTNTLQQGYYNLGIAASDTDPDILLVGCLNLWRSEDGGASFQAMGGYQGSVSWIHPDQQEIEINGNDMWIANDGGINFSSDYFTSHESRKTGLIASDYWGFGSGWNDDLLVGGRYHNGNSAYRPSFENGQFLRLGGGEAATGYVQPGGDQISFFSDISAKKIPFSLDAAVENVANLSLFPFESYFAANYSELIFDPDCYTHMILGRDNKIFKTVNNGGSFEELASLGEADHPVMQLEQSRSDKNVLYAYQRTSFYGATLWLSLDGGVNWEAKDFPSGASSMRSGTMSIHSQSPGTLWVAFSHQTNDGNKIWKTEDFGNTWTNISEAILDGERIQSILHHDGTEADIYIGTDYGIYYHDGIQWSTCNNGLPFRFNVNKLLPFYKENKLRAATYGNGIWEMELTRSTSPLAQATVDKLSSNCVRDTFYFDDYSVLLHDNNVKWEWSFSPEPSYVSDLNARNPKVVFGALGSYDVVLTVSNDLGSHVFEKADMIDISDNICQPDIYPGEAMACYQNGSDYVQLPDLNATWSSFTLTAWVKPNGMQNDYTGIIFNDDQSTGLNFSTNNQLGFHYQDAGSAAWAWQSNLIVPIDEWSHVAMVAEPTGVSLYLNGILAKRDLSLVPALLGTMKLGSYKGWTSRNFNGLMDEVCIWNRALSEKELREHRHITKSLGNSNGLVSYYQFNESDGRAIDRIGLNHGNFSGLSDREISFAPIGGGSSLGMYGLTGPSNFNDQNIQIDASCDLEDMVVVSKLDISPQNLEIENAFPSDQYWIINQYGSVNVNEISFSNQSIETYYESNPNEISLFERAENNSEIDFSEVSGAHSAIAGNNGSFAFNLLNGLNKQFIASKEILSGLSDLEPNTLTLSPNPSNSDVQIISKVTWTKIVLRDSKGNFVKEQEIGRDKKITIDNLSPGIYFYLLMAEKKLKTGKLIVTD